TTKEGKRQQKVLDGMTCTTECPECHGTRLNERVRSCRIMGKNLADVVAMPITEALAFVDTIDHPLASDLKGELHKRLQALCDIGLGYLSLSRGTGTLSGGEAQRIKIAKYINSPLTDMAYVLDEPSVGLHPQDISRLKTSLRHLRDHGNTVLIVEHHREIIAMADHLVDMGPGAGDHGGKITFEGGYDGLLASDTVTGRMLRDRTPLKSLFRTPTGWYHIKDATLHNLKHIDVEIPQGVITVIAGVAGSGKSSLMEFFMQQESTPLVFIGQKDIGINLRSTPATYLDISDTIRRLFAKEGLVDGQHPAHTSVQLFSFNSKGACPACGGKGVIVSDMAFMESIETVCEECHGSRYNHEALQYRYRGKTIAEVMDLTVEEAIEFFSGMAFLPQLQMLEKVGLGYLPLNQSMSTLSGGELQRGKLADRLYSTAIHLSATETRLSGGHTYIIDEPTDGLHLDDVRRLLELFDEMVDAGNTLILIEQSLDVMKRADYMIELGPGGGDNGGQLLFCGTPDTVLHAPQSVTAPYIMDSLPFDRA
ncbi:MAG: ATP-binding cassette domain-containing protein, partial [Bacteroidales bacterium]|nr:ATP-binding cassette domain-containing protein [Bacteroidales bacterium]